MEARDSLDVGAVLMSELLLSVEWRDGQGGVPLLQRCRCFWNAESPYKCDSALNDFSPYKSRLLTLECIKDIYVSRPFCLDWVCREAEASQRHASLTEVVYHPCRQRKKTPLSKTPYRPWSRFQSSTLDQYRVQPAGQGTGETLSHVDRGS